jgi:hypothetical protein
MPNFEVRSVYPVFNKRHANGHKKISTLHISYKPVGYVRGKTVHVHAINGYDGVKE